MMRKSIATVATVGIVAGLTGIAVAGMNAGNAARAAVTAIEAAGGAWATPAPSTDEGVSWRFHVIRTDGSNADVLLDDRLQVVAINDVQVVAQAASYSPASSHQPDAHDAEQPVPTADADRAAQAALKATGGGTVHDVDRDVEGGATWEVEITTPDGKAVDVLLDKEFRVLSVGDEQEANEGPDDATGTHEDRDDDDRDD